MFKFLKAGAAKDAPGPDPAPESVPQPSAQHHTDLKRELIQVVLKDTLRRRGVPFDWLTCEVFVAPRGPGEEDLHIQLTLVKWQEMLLRYAQALEHQLMLGLDRFDPSVDHSKYIISWRVSPDCGCPFAVMPPARFWSHVEEPAADAVADEAPAILDRRHAKRPPNASARAREPASAALQPGAPPVASAHPGPPPDDGEYQRTQLSPLR